MRRQTQLHLNAILHPDRPLIVDSFAGGGGASTGLSIAFGREPDIAINHDAEALRMHMANHPQTRHFCESVWDVDPLEATGGRPVGAAWFSPDCKHFSKAKGSKPRDKGIRGLAWVVLRWVNAVAPAVIYLENVEEFQQWCPLVTKAHAHRLGNPRLEGHPSKWRPSWFFRCFVGALRRRGYAVEWRQLRACDYGAPTIRKRLFLVARRDGLPIAWPSPTHAAPDSPEVAAKRLQPWRTAAECIDWSIPCPSIFERKRPLAEATCRRIAKGIMRYVVNAKEPFIVNLTHGGRIEPIDEPFRTITGAHRGEKAIVVPHVQRQFGQSVGSPADAPIGTVMAEGLGKSALVSAHLTECANGSQDRVFSAEEPLRTQCAEVKGGHFALVSAFLAKHYTGVVGSDLAEPVATVTATDHHSLVTAHIAKLRGDNVGQPADEPLHTVSAQGTHFAEVQAFLIKYYGNEKEAIPLTDPAHTVTARDRFALVTIKGVQYAIADIGLRMLTPRELFRAQGFPDDYIIGDPGDPIRLTKSAQVRMCGNSVCPPVATAIAMANTPRLALAAIA